MTTTTTAYNNNRIVTHVGTSGFTVTSTRIGDEVNVLMEFDFTSREECAALVGSLLAHLDTHYGENLATQCFAHYAQDSGKKPVRHVGKRDEYRIRGYKDGRR